MAQNGFEGEASCVYTLIDNQGGSDTATLTITVEAAPNVAPTISGLPSALTRTVGDSAIAFGVDIADVNGDAMTYTATITNNTTGESIVLTGDVSGTSTDKTVNFSLPCPSSGGGGELEVTFTLNDGTAAPVTDVCTVTVDPAPPPC